MAEKNYDISKLLDVYGNILSERQRLCVELYYNDDLSLSEIADELGISRQGVRASLKKSEDTLLELEKKLGFSKRFDITVKHCERLRRLAKDMKKKSESIGSEEFARYASEIETFTKRMEQEFE